MLAVIIWKRCCDMNHKNTILAAFLILLLSIAGFGDSYADAPRRPTPAESLAGEGFEANREGIFHAVASNNDWAKIYAIRLVKELNDPTFIETVLPLLDASYLRLQFEVAALLAHFNMQNGITWLENCDKIPYGITSLRADTAHIVLDAASTLAARGNERLVGHLSHLLDHEQWSVRIHAVRALGEFKQTDNPVLEHTWIKSVDVAIVALNDGIDNENFVELYLTWLVSSLFQQSNLTIAITDKMTELAAIQHPVICRTIGVRLYGNESDHGHDHSEDQDHEH